MKNKTHVYRFSQFLLLYTLLVILWGAWVRISHSGDGCGASWPLCHGQIVPTAEHKKTWVEFSHRITSGLFGILVVYLFWRGRKIFEKGTAVRKAIFATLFFTITESLLGAKLVLFGLVGSNDSVFRLFVMGLHQVNSLLLSGSVAMVALFASGLPEKLQASLQSSLQPSSPSPSPKPASTPTTFLSLPKGAVIFLVLFTCIAITGAFASLSTTLFPSTNLLDGLVRDFAPDAHYLLKLRISHPILATLIGGGLAIFFWLRAQEEHNAILQKANLQVALIFVGGVVFGYMTLFSLAPIWMKMVHLLIAHTIWITLLRWYWLTRTATKASKSIL